MVLRIMCSYRKLMICLAGLTEIDGGINLLVLAILNIEQKYWELSPHQAPRPNSYTVSDTKALHYQCNGSTSTFVKLCELGDNTE